MSKILLDTCVIIDFIRRKDKENSLFVDLFKKTDLLCSMVTHTEMFSGKSVWGNKKAREELETIFSSVEIINLDLEISTKAGEIKAKYGTNLLDAIIAATALTQGLHLATLNIKDFQIIKDLKLK